VASLPSATLTALLPLSPPLLPRLLAPLKEGALLMLLLLPALSRLLLLLLLLPFRLLLLPAAPATLMPRAMMRCAFMALRVSTRRPLCVCRKRSSGMTTSCHSPGLRAQHALHEAYAAQCVTPERLEHALLSLARPTRAVHAARWVH
jgi:hypothetical protein